MCTCEQTTVTETDKCNTSSTLLPTISDGSLGAWDAAGVIAVVVDLQHERRRNNTEKLKTCSESPVTSPSRNKLRGHVQPSGASLNS
jgi:hypothetical protein